MVLQNTDKLLRSTANPNLAFGQDIPGGDFRQYLDVPLQSNLSETLELYITKASLEVLKKSLKKCATILNKKYSQSKT